MVAIVETTSESKHRGRTQRRRPDVCSAENPRFSNSPRLIVVRWSLPVDHSQYPAIYPGTAALSRAERGTGFRGGDAEHNCGELRSLPLNPGAAAHCRGVGTGFRGADAARKCIEHRSLPLNINGANTYRFVMSNPVGNVDPLGNAVSATGQVSPSTAKGGAPGSGSVSATGTTGPIPTGIPGTTVTVGGSGKVTTGGNYTGTATRTVTVKTGGGSSVSVTASGGGSGKITKNPASPAGQEQVKGQLNFPIVPGSLLSLFCVYNPQNGKYSGGFKYSVGKNTTVGLNIQPVPGGTSVMVTGTFRY